MAATTWKRRSKAVLGFIFGFPIDVTPVVTDVTGDAGDFDFDDPLTSLTSFNWSYSGAIPLAYLTVKASDGFAIFDIMRDTSGFVDLDGIVMNPGGQTPTVSHVGYWST